MDQGKVDGVSCLRPKLSLENIPKFYRYEVGDLSGILNDKSASICPAEYPLPDSPPSTMFPHSDSKNITVQHGEQFLAAANGDLDDSMKRPRGDEEDKDEAKRSKKARFLNQSNKFALDDLYSDICEDRDTTILNIEAALASMQHQIDVLKEQWHRREDDERCQKARVVANWARHRAIKQEH